LQEQRPRTRVRNAYAASHGSIFLHSFLAGRLAGDGKLLGDLIANAKKASMA
jgi:hypothetical protein